MCAHAGLLIRLLSDDCMIKNVALTFCKGNLNNPLMVSRCLGKLFKIMMYLGYTEVNTSFFWVSSDQCSFQAFKGSSRSESNISIIMYG